MSENKGDAYRAIQYSVDDVLLEIDKLHVLAEKTGDRKITRLLIEAQNALIGAQQRAETGAEAEDLIDGLTPAGQAFVRGQMEG